MNILSIFDRNRRTFKHGIHPPDEKSTTNALPIRQFSFSPTIVLPLVQHIGKAPNVLVNEGEEVIRGQLLASPNGFMSVPLHAPVTGKIRSLCPVPSIKGNMVPGIVMETSTYSTQEIKGGTQVDLSTASSDSILQGIQNAGIVGLGGAAFPTHVKLKVPEGKTCEVLLVNGIECEPYLTTDHRVMLEQADDIFKGIEYVQKATGAQKVIIGVEANKRDAAAHLESQIPEHLDIRVEVVPVKYPQGAEKMLITSLLNREVPSGGLPIDVGALVINVATTAEIGRLLPMGRGIMERVVTITGPAIGKKGNYLIPIGTPLRYVLEQVEAEKDITEVYMGGPMMGVAISNLDISIVKGTSGIVAFTKRDVKRNRQIYPCIKCGACVDACPISLNPARLGLLARNEEYDMMADSFNLFDCFECGSCSYVCPSNIPLVQYFRLSKSIMRKRAQMNKEKVNAE